MQKKRELLWHLRGCLQVLRRTSSMCGFQLICDVPFVWKSTLYVSVSSYRGSRHTSAPLTTHSLTLQCCIPQHSCLLSVSSDLYLFLPHSPLCAHSAWQWYTPLPSHLFVTLVQLKVWQQRQHTVHCVSVYPTSRKMQLNAVFFTLMAKHLLQSASILGEMCDRRT